MTRFPSRDSFSLTPPLRWARASGVIAVNANNATTMQANLFNIAISCYEDIKLNNLYSHNQSLESSNHLSEAEYFW